MGTKTQSSHSRQVKSRKSNISRQDIEHYFRKTLKLNKDKHTLRRGADPDQASTTLDPRTKMYWKLKKQVNKDSEIYGQDRISEYAQNFDAKTREETVAINRISQQAIEEASQVPDRGKANSRISAKELEDDIKMQDREKRNGSQRFITVVNEQ